MNWRNAKSKLRKFKVAKEEGIIVAGKVVKAERGRFVVEAKMGDETKLIVAQLSGKLRKNFIRIVPGDLVDVEVSPYDFSKGRILYRRK